MRSFFYEPVSRLGYVGALQKERNNLARLIEPETYDFFSHNNYTELRFSTKVEGSAQVEKFWQCMEGRTLESVGWTKILRLTMYEHPRWTFFEIDAECDGGSVGKYMTMAFLVYMNSDVDAVEYKLRFK
jgi:hypothetical protein